MAHRGPLLAASVLLVVSQSVNQNVILVIFVLSAAAMAVHSYLPAFWPLPTAFLSEAAAAACIGMINSFGNLGGFVGPYVMGFLRDRTGNYAAGIAYLAGSSLVGGLMILSVRKTQGTRRTQHVPRN